MAGYSTSRSAAPSACAEATTAPATSPTRDADGYITYVGRADDVFKSSDYRISPFELESALVEHAAMAEAAVVPSPDALRLSVPKAFVVVRAEVVASRELALTLFRFVRGRLPPLQADQLHRVRANCRRRSRGRSGGWSSGSGGTAPL